MDSQSVRGEFSAHSPGNGPKWILSVDDDPGILGSRQLLQQGAGFAVLSAADGEQALDLFTANCVDLVLLDYLMPGMNGGAVAEEMKRRKPLIPVVMVSASWIEEDLSHCVNCFIPKGQGPAFLLERVAQILSPVAIEPSRKGQASLSDVLTYLKRWPRQGRTGTGG
jgi:CheY-like chemotaxis protein